MSDSLGDRMKEYENSFRFFLPKKHHYILRVDGRAFHSLKLDKPYDYIFMKAMRDATNDLFNEIQGAKFGYTQSDESSIYFTDITDNPNSESWFANNLNKIVSLSASLMTSSFNKDYGSNDCQFDSRVFLIPQHDIPNYFLWRIKDWNRNSLNMEAQFHFSHRELQGKKASDLHEMLHSVGVNWADNWTAVKNGTYFTKGATKSLETKDISYQGISELIWPENTADSAPRMASISL